MEISENVKNVILVAEGGIGKNINATAVLRALRKQYPKKKIHVVAGAIEPYLHNPGCKKIYSFANPLYFYDDYFVDSPEETIVIKEEAYTSYDYYAGREHVVNCWCKKIGIEPDGVEGDLFFTMSNLTAAKDYVDSITDKGKKDFILLQWVGGKVPDTPQTKDYINALAQMYKRSIPKEEAQKVVNALVEKGYVVGVVGHPNFPQLDGAINIHYPLRQVLALIPFCKTFIAIDSFLQHAAACTQIKKRGLVLWGGTDPKKLGYDLHKNVTKEVCENPFCGRPMSYLFDNSNGAPWSCPHSEACMAYTSEEILKEFEEFEETKEVDVVIENKETEDVHI